MYVHYYERELMNEGDNPLIGGRGECLGKKE